MFGPFLDWFERHKFGVVGTLMLHTVLMFLLAMTALHGERHDGSPTEIALTLDHPTEIPPQDQLQAPRMAPFNVKNLTSNSTADAQPTRQNLSHAARERIATNVEEDLKAFEKAEFDKLAQERAAKGEDVKMPQLDPSKWDKERYMDKPVKPVKVEGLTTVSYDLKDRSDIVLNVPAYKCVGQGTVVVRVSVRTDGEVDKAEVDERASTTDECMLANALASARGARFTRSSTAPDPQRGNITYIFLAQ